jgi:hypothetical protein
MLAHFLDEANLSFTALHQGHFSHSTLAGYFSMALPIYQKTAKQQVYKFFMIFQR